RFDDIETAELKSDERRVAEPDLRDQLNAAIDGLPDIYRSVFVLHEIEGHSHEEIGTLLRIPAGTSKARLFEARARLRTSLKAFEESGSVHDDPKFNEFLKRNAAGYRADAQAPADELWEHIQRDVAEAIAPSHARRFGQRFWITTGAAVAAALILGVGIGRW